jgi:hypothetical protein
MALAQTTYNVVGVLLFYPIPFMRAIPIHLAKKLGNIVAKVALKFGTNYF